MADDFFFAMNDPVDGNGDRKDRKKKDKKRSRSRERERKRAGSRSRGRGSKRSRSRDRSRREEPKKKRSPSPMDPAKLEEEARRKAMEAEREAHRDEYTVFVSQIFPKVDERDLFEFFSLVGRVEDIRLIRDQRTQKSKGLAYVEFWERDSVHKAVALTGQLLRGYPITIQVTQTAKQKEVVIAGDQPMKLYVGNLRDIVTTEDLMPVFEAFGPVTSVEIVRDSDNKSKGYGFVVYKKKDDAETALNALNGLDLAGQAIKVGRADLSQQPDLGNNVGELDDGEGGGLALSAQGRAALMAKLARSGGGPTMPPMPAAMSVMLHPPPVHHPAPHVPVQPTTCLVIKNMFDPRTEPEPDFDQDIKEDLEDESEKFGKLKHCFVDKNSMGFGYMRFQNIQAAVLAQKAFHGRWFASRQITCEYVPEATYTAKFPQSGK